MNLWMIGGTLFEKSFEEGFVSQGRTSGGVYRHGDKEFTGRDMRNAWRNFVDAICSKKGNDDGR